MDHWAHHTLPPRSNLPVAEQGSQRSRKRGTGIALRRGAGFVAGVLQIAQDVTTTAIVTKIYRPKSCAQAFLGYPPKESFLLPGFKQGSELLDPQPFFL